MSLHQMVPPSWEWTCDQCGATLATEPCVDPPLPEHWSHIVFKVQMGNGVQLRPIVDYCGRCTGAVLEVLPDA